MTSYKLVMPEGMNHHGFLFGGKMLMWIDEIAWMAVSVDENGMKRKMEDRRHHRRTAGDFS